MKYLIFLFIIFSLFSCQHNVELTNVYVGCYRMHDQQLAVPQLLVKEKGQLVMISAKGEEIDRAEYNAPLLAIGDSVMFKNRPLNIHRLTSDGRVGFSNWNDTSFEGQLSRFAPTFYRAVEDRPLEITKVAEILQQGTWDYLPTPRVPNRDLNIKHELTFQRSELLDLTINHYNGMEILRESKKLTYQFFVLAGQVFISFNPSEADENPFPIFHVIEASPNEVVWVRNDDRFPKEERLIKNRSENAQGDIKLLTSESFSLCFNAAVGEYYYGDVNYLEGNDYLIKLANLNLPKVDVNGYVNVHFHINCHGQVGEIGLEQMDFDFQPANYPTVLIKHLVDMVVKLDRWPSIVDQDSRLEFKDVHAFLMFKLVDGKIVDLCP